MIEHLCTRISILGILDFFTNTLDLINHRGLFVSLEIYMSKKKIIMTDNNNNKKAQFLINLRAKIEREKQKTKTTLYLKIFQSKE